MSDEEGSRKSRRLSEPQSDSASSLGPLLVVWDFDWSLINENSDTYVLEVLQPAVCEAAMKKRNMQWTKLMDWALGELHKHGVAPDALRDALKSAPILDGSLAAVQVAAAAGAEQRILSDANTIYIETILAAHPGLADAFSSVETNPAAFDSAGRLRVQPHQDTVADGAPHECPLCPNNLCKGAVLEAWISKTKPRRCVYVGDGSGDFCPAARLRAHDFVLARKAPHDSLLCHCREYSERIAAHVLEWDEEANGASLLEAMKEAVAV